MSQSNREAAITETLKWEGGYSNNPADPGGPTNWGITIADARRYWKKGATAADVRAMPKAVAIDIYRQKYWVTSYYDCDKLASGVDLAVFDFGVNSGPSRAKRYLDLSVGGTPSDTVNKICDKRLGFLKGLGTWGTFGAGWSRRVKGIRTKALQMAAAQPKTPDPTSSAAKVIVAGGAAAPAAKAAGYDWWTAGEVGLAVLIAGLVIWFIVHQYKKGS